ncbi:TlpA family protein disulfide reductase [Sphingobacterium wenxiniae]|uniref:Peroxiredoxin n=1 Tax=Sphingobacterium wenxiniae TaxID=683125 RepID=A0A1I6R7Y6_9SPHI|nr:TlpA disulfide reductase family protein [Sphingobacterium wenxiniae]SFS60766.1 Peroxiredoxin [Sphingobacterium wenxiniae]
MKRVILLLCAVICAVQLKAQEEWKVAVGEKVPLFTVENKKNEPMPMGAMKGKVVLLNFFATWCPPCRQELPRLQKEVWEKWGERADFEVMVLAREEGWDKLDPFMANNKYTFPVYPDLRREVFSLFAESLIPRNVLVNKEGKIIYQSIGYSAEEFDELIALIEKSLEE